MLKNNAPRRRRLGEIAIVTNAWNHGTYNKSNSPAIVKSAGRVAIAIK